MKIVVGSFQQESNTLTSRMSCYDDFVIHRGPEMLDHIAATELFVQAGCTILPTLYANALPGGPLLQADFFRLADELVGLIPSENIDGLWLHLHGAMEVEHIGSGELALLTMIRQQIGNDVPIVLALDFHANNEEQLMKLITCVVGYRTAPHRDIEETQRKAAQLLLRCITESLHPKIGMVRVPVVVPGDCVLTDEEPLRSIMEEALVFEHREGMLVCNVFNGQSWVDSPRMGPSIVCVHAWDEQAAEQVAVELAEKFFLSRHEFSFSVEACEPDEALERAYLEERHPVFVTDSGDNTTAGAAGDNAFLLERVLSHSMTNVLIGGLTDERAVLMCHRSGVGAHLTLTVGGAFEHTSQRCTIDASVIHVGDIEGWYGENAGPCAVVRTAGVDVILTARRCALVKPSIFSNLGLRVENYRFVVVKLGYLYPELATISERTILALTKGTSTERLQDMPMRRIRRPVFPLDDDFDPGFTAIV